VLLARPVLLAQRVPPVLRVLLAPPVLRVLLAPPVHPSIESGALHSAGLT